MAAEALQNMNISNEEMGKLAKSLKDPKFRELLEEYAREISEPSKKEEIEDYIKFAEERSRLLNGGIMEGKDLLMPIANFCVKTRNKDTGLKIFINICHCDKLEKPTSIDHIGRKGVEWKIPYSLSQIHNDKDKGGKDCQSVDFVVNEEACKKARESNPFKRFLAQTAIDSIEKQYGLKIDQDFVFPRLKYKGHTGNPKMLKITKVSGDEESKTCTTKCNSDALQPQTTKNSQPVQLECDQLPKPTYEIVYRNDLDLGHYWADKNTNFQADLRRPKDIVWKVDLPNVLSARDIELDISDTEGLVMVPGKYKLQMKWKYQVDSAKSWAKFDISTHKLEVSIPIVAENKHHDIPVVH